jgi:hypothetical protein
LLLGGCAEMQSMLHTHHMVNVQLSGADEVPPVNTAARGAGTITVGADKAVSGSVTTTGLPTAMAAHIHTGARGQNGPIAVGMVKTGDNVWSIPSGSRFTDAQYQAFMAGNTYVNVHTPANKGGEIRGQLRP